MGSKRRINGVDERDKKKLVEPERLGDLLPNRQVSERENLIQLESSSRLVFFCCPNFGFLMLRARLTAYGLNSVGVGIY